MHDDHGRDEHDDEREIADGLECPACGCRHLPVLYTRKRHQAVVRVRICRHCGRRITTREKL